MEEDTMTSTPAGFAPAAMNRAIARYSKAWKSADGYANHELALRSAFQNLLAEAAEAVNLTLIPEQTIEGGIRPAGVLRDSLRRRGIWEAQGPESNLDQEIQTKVTAGYPLENALFENSRIAILYQNKKRVPVVFDLGKASDVRDLLHSFLRQSAPDIESFAAAVQDVKNRLPSLVEEIRATLDREHAHNQVFTDAFSAFATFCRTTLHPEIGHNELKEILAQHLLTVRLLRTVCNDADVLNNNAFAAEAEHVTQALLECSWNRQELLKPLDRFYVAIETAARGIETWSERQHFLNTVYERCFQGFSPEKAETNGIVYTPQEIVDFMVASVDAVLQQYFCTSLAQPGVKILDPATGTGNFIVNIMQHIPHGVLEEKYTHDLFCNETMLLPYSIASLNIEHEYYHRMGQYTTFEGACFADTLELAESQQLSFLMEKNAKRVEREKAADIMVIIGNPPYNVGQTREHDNNKNRTYALVDQRIKDTYVKYSQATLRTQLYDAYVRFFRWATDRLQNRDGVICFVSNNGFLDGIAFDGFRKQLTEEFTHIYHLDLGGDVRSHGGGNVFGVKVGVGITLLIRQRARAEQANTPAKIFYCQTNTLQTGQEKRAFLQRMGNVTQIDWQILQPDARHFWLTEGIQQEFASFVAMGSKQAKSSRSETVPVIFTTYSTGVKTNRDAWVYDFSPTALAEKIKRFAQAYTTELDRWTRRGNSAISLDDFVTYADPGLKWSRNLKRDLQQHRHFHIDPGKIRRSLYRPFTQTWLYFADMAVDERGTNHLHFPNPSAEAENRVIVVSDHGSRSPFSVLATNLLPDLHLLAATDAFQCFPYYTYAADGTGRQENITDWALAHFQAHYGQSERAEGRSITKWDIFYYVYAMLHHPHYRERYAGNLKRDLPHLPLLLRPEAFEAAARIGQQLMDIHVNYEQVAAYPLQDIEDETVPYLETRRITRMKLSPDRTAVVLNQGLTLAGLPESCFRYRLGNRSALEWVLDQYQVTTDKGGEILSDPNRPDDPEYIVHLIKKVVTVSIQTGELVEELAQAVTPQDWSGTASGAEHQAESSMPHLPGLQ